MSSSSSLNNSRIQRNITDETQFDGVGQALDLRVFQELAARVPILRQLRNRFPRILENRMPARVAVLHIEHRVVLGLLDHLGEIEFQHRVVLPKQHHETHGIRADIAGVELDSRGYVKVNERLETTAPGVWAMGDCAGSPQFTHVAFDDFRIVRDNLNGGNRTTRNRLVPFCMFTDPELARVGLNESEAQARGIAYRTARMPMAAVLRTRTLSAERGFMKILIDTASDRILGFTVFGVEASELMAAVQTAMLGQLPFTLLRDALFTHPTAAEGLTVLLADAAAAPTAAGQR